LQSTAVDWLLALRLFSGSKDPGRRCPWAIFRLGTSFEVIVNLRAESGQVNSQNVVQRDFSVRKGARIVVKSIRPEGAVGAAFGS
jgi:hypothetical protein